MLEGENGRRGKERESVHQGGELIVGVDGGEVGRHGGRGREEGWKVGGGWGTYVINRRGLYWKEEGG